MKWARGLLFHGALLVVAAAVALLVWTKSEQPTTITREQVRVWDGKPDDVQSIEFSNKDTKLDIEAHRDDLGRWYVCTLDQTTEEHVPIPSSTSSDAGATPTPSKPAVGPHGAKNGTQRARRLGHLDAGHAHPALSSTKNASRSPGDAGGPPAPPKMKTVTHHKHRVFVSVSAADQLVKSLAPLEAYRKIGKIDPKEAGDFGLDKPKGTMRITIGGKTHSLQLGGTTPGGGDRYAKDLDDGQVYAIPGEIAWSLLYADSRLVERELHKWKMTDVQRILIDAGHAQREVVRVPKKVDSWANPKTPNKPDETIGNWLAKLEQLRVMQYVEKPKLAPTDLIVRVTFHDKSNKLGMLELWKTKGDKDKIPEYLVRTEYTRWYAKVLHSTAAEVEQDVKEVVK